MPRRELLDVVVYEENGLGPDFDINSILDPDEAIEILQNIILWLKSQDSQRVLYRVK